MNSKKDRAITTLVNKITWLILGISLFLFISNEVTANECAAIHFSQENIENNEYVVVKGDNGIGVPLDLFNYRDIKEGNYSHMPSEGNHHLFLKLHFYHLTTLSENKVDILKQRVRHSFQGNLPERMTLPVKGSNAVARSTLGY
jgi:hypothetical protein